MHFFFENLKYRFCSLVIDCFSSHDEFMNDRYALERFGNMYARKLERTKNVMEKPQRIQCSQKVSFCPETGPEFLKNDQNPKLFDTIVFLLEFSIFL